MADKQASTELCQLCRKTQFKYTCPKCNTLYCSVQCYRSPEHTRCSEEFYRTCIKEELHSTATGANSKEDMRKIYDILRRIREADAGLQPDDFDDGLADPLDSDDDDNSINVEGHAPQVDGITEDCDDEEDLAKRLQGINLNNADEVWERLTDAEREEFQKLVDCGDIMKLLPTHQPWWTIVAAERKRRTSKIVELPAQPSTTGNKNNTTPAAPFGGIPNIASNIPRFTTICRKDPSPSIHYNLWNIMSAYACVVRHFAGDHLVNVSEAAAQLVNLSATLKYGTNFEDADDAIISVEMEALTTGNGAQTGGVAMPVGFAVESREQLQQDARQLMITQHCKAAALSDVLRCFQLARHQLKTQKQNNIQRPDGETAKFHKLFAICSGSVELTPRKLLELSKKIEFYLAYVQRDDVQAVK